MTIMISNLPLFVNDNDVAAIFKIFGQVKFAQVFKCPRGGENLGSAIVGMDDCHEVSFAVYVLNHLLIEGKQLMVAVAEDQNPLYSYRPGNSGPAYLKMAFVEN